MTKSSQTKNSVLLGLHTSWRKNAPYFALHSCVSTPLQYFQAKHPKQVALQISLGTSKYYLK